MSKLKIVPGKFYMTDEGNKAKIYATDNGGTNPIHGAILVVDGWYLDADYGSKTYWKLASWDENGKYTTFDSPNDIVREWPKHLN